MAHIRKKFFLGPGLFSGSYGFNLMYHDNQQHTDYSQHTECQHGHTQSRKCPALFQKNFLVYRHDKVQAHFIFKGHKVKELPVFLLFVRMVKTKGFFIRQLLCNFFIRKLRVLSLCQMLIQIVSFIPVNLLIDIYDIIAVPVNQSAVAAAFPVFNKTVNHHMVFDGRNIADSRQCRHFSSAHTEIFQPDAVKNTLSVQPSRFRIVIQPGKHFFLSICKIRPKIQSSCFIFHTVGQVFVCVDCAILSHQTNPCKSACSAFQIQIFLDFSDSLTVIMSETLFHLI